MPGENSIKTILIHILSTKDSYIKGIKVGVEVHHDQHEGKLGIACYVRVGLGA
jgi:hypothetical protein